MQMESVTNEEINSYYFSVEGENEQWYFEYLQKLIKQC